MKRAISVAALVLAALLVWGGRHLLSSSQARTSAQRAESILEAAATWRENLKRPSYQGISMTALIGRRLIATGLTTAWNTPYEVTPKGDGVAISFCTPTSADARAVESVAASTNSSVSIQAEGCACSQCRVEIARP